MLQLASTFLLGRSESAPSGSLAVEYLVQASSAAPSGKSLCGYSLFFEVVELVLKAMGGQPSPGFFDCVAVWNAVQGDLRLFHG